MVAEGRPPPVIRGREKELETVRELVRAVKRGGSGGLLIEGECGLGKSLLLEQAARIAGEEHVLVANGPVEGPGDEAAGIWWDGLGKRSEQTPLLLSMDDLQSAGQTAWRALSTLPDRVGRYPVAWLLARRVPDQDGGSDRLFGRLEERGAARLTLSPLASGAACDLITDVAGAAPGPRLLALARGAAGNPFLLHELVAGLIEEGGVAIRDGQAVALRTLMPRRVHAAVRRMLHGAARATWHLLETAAVLGQSFRVQDAAVMLGTPPAALLPCVEEAIAARVLNAADDALMFRNEVIRQAFAEGLPQPVAQALHRQFGEILLARGDSPALAGAHLLSGVGAGDTAVLAELDRAAAEVLPTVPEVAADLATRALALTEPTDPKILPRTATATESLAAAGQPSRATRLARSVLAVPRPAAATARLRCALSSALLLNGQATEALAEASQVLAEPRVARDTRDDAKTVLLQALAGLHDYRRAGELAAAIIAEPGEQRCEMVTTAMVVLAGVMWDAGRLSEAMEVSANAVRLATGQPTGAWRLHPHLFLAARLVDLRRLDEARAVMRSAPGRLDALEPIQWSATAPMLDARIALAAGRLDDAVRRAEDALNTAAEQTRRTASTPRAVLAAVALRRGDLKAAREHLEGGGVPEHTATGPWHSVIAAQVREAADGPKAALAMITVAYDEAGKHRLPLLGDPARPAWLVRTALAAGDHKRAEAVRAAATEIAAGNPGLAAVTVSAAHACGLLERDRGQLELAAEEHLDRWAKASAAEDLAGLELDTGLRRSAISRLDQALKDYQTAGAARDVARVRRRLRRLGVRRGHWRAEDRPVSGWDSLTATEQAVSDLISQGLTNQQAADQMFISMHTIAFHLRQVFRKLGVSSRVEMTRLVVEQARTAAAKRRPAAAERGGSVSDRTQSYPV